MMATETSFSTPLQQAPGASAWVGSGYRTGLVEAAEQSPGPGEWPAVAVQKVGNDWITGEWRDDAWALSFLDPQVLL